MFDGVGCLRIACDLLGLPMAGHVSVEKTAEGRRVVEAAFADTIFVEDVALVDAEMVAEWAGKFSQVGLVLLGAGPPCQGVSGLNADKRGALRDHRSCLFQHVPRIRELLKKGFPCAQVLSISEAVQFIKGLPPLPPTPDIFFSSRMGKHHDHHGSEGRKSIKIAPKNCLM